MIVYSSSSPGNRSRASLAMPTGSLGRSSVVCLAAARALEARRGALIEVAASETGKVFAEADVDFRRRAEPEAVLAVLRAIP